MRFLGIKVVDRAKSQSVKIYVEKLKQIPLGRITWKMVRTWKELRVRKQNLRLIWWRAG
jgi:hypothetical protein